MVVYVVFLCDVASQKLLNSANVSRSYSQNNTGTVFLRHGVDILFTSEFCQLVSLGAETFTCSCRVIILYRPVGETWA